MQADQAILCSSVLTLSRDHGGQCGTVKTNQDIRRANLLLLLEEVARELKTSRGAASELAKRTGVAGPQISQVKAGKLHHGGKSRSLGDDIARKLERGMSKPKGWMDVEHHQDVSARESETLNSLRALTPDQRELVEKQIAEYARLNGHQAPGSGTEAGAITRH